MIWPLVTLYLLTNSLLFTLTGQLLRHVLDVLLGSENGYYFYVAFFSYNRGYILFFTYILLVALSLLIVINRFIRYFTTIGIGIGELLNNSEQPIVLAADLSDIQQRLNAAKAVLIRRKNDALDSEQRKNDLVVYLAHDLKTPLTSVIGYLELLQEAPDMPTVQRSKYIGIVLRKAQRLETLIDEFFEITRFNLQHLPLNKRNIQLSLMLEQLADEFYPILAERGMHADVHCAKDLTIEADADLLARTLNNLLKNAAAYGNAGSSVTIAAGAESNGVKLSFTNQGHPLSTDELAHLFEKFYRLDSARSSHSGGAGLGLAIAKRIIELHGGTISAACEGNHTTFTVWLPVTTSS